MGMVRLVGGLLGALLVVAVILAVVGLAAAFWPVTIVVCLVGGGWALRKGVRGIRALRHL